MNLELFQIINFNIQYLQSISSAPYLSISLPAFKVCLSSLRGCESGRHENLPKKTKTKQNKTNEQNQNKKKKWTNLLLLNQNMQNQGPMNKFQIKTNLKRGWFRHGL